MINDSHRDPQINHNERKAPPQPIIYDIPVTVESQLEKEKKKLLQEIVEYDRIMEIQNEQLRLKDKQIQALKMKSTLVSNNEDK